MAGAKSFTDLIVWQKAHMLALAVYKVTKIFPAEERLGITSQMRRAAVSVTSNITEGFERQSKKDMERFFVMARASLGELQNQLLLSRDLGYIKQSDFAKLADMTVEVHKLINGFIKSIHKPSSNSTRNSSLVTRNSTRN